MRIKKDRAYYGWAGVSAFLAFGIGYIQHRFFYPLEFHGDAAALQVLANAILREGSLLPSNFSYGNQIIFLRSSWFIALASSFGLTGLKAFIVGSSLTIAFWGAILHFFLAAFLGSSRKGTLFLVLLLLPFGLWESDLVLGQQSHLANVVLCLGLVVSISLYIAGREVFFVGAACACLFVMSSEAPIRGLLVLGPLFVALVITIGLRRAVVMTMPLGVAFLAAYFVNKALVLFRPPAIQLLETLSFKPAAEILNNLGRMSTETLMSISSIDVIAGDRLSLGGFLVLGSSILLLLVYLGFFGFGILETTKIAAAKLGNPLQTDASNSEKESVRLVRLTSIFGMILGLLAVSALNPDSARHYLWAVFLAKLFVFHFMFYCLSSVAGHRIVAAIMVASAFLMSSWFAYLVHLHGNTAKSIRERTQSEVIASIQEISRKTGIKNIYGEDFWHLMPLNTLIPGVNAQTLFVDKGAIVPFLWLSMPSWSCMEGEVLYYLKGLPVDEEIRKKLMAAHGAELKSGAGYSIWKGPRVWQLPASCYKTTAIAYEGEQFLALPSAVGMRQGNAKKTDGNTGFLLFGPYTSLPPGRYDLILHGTSESVVGAYVDVASNNGQVVHGRFKVGQSVKGPVLVQTVVDVAPEARELEVRVWVGPQDSLELTGYSLKPHPKK